jgi:hypothetical protein
VNARTLAGLTLLVLGLWFAWTLLESPAPEPAPPTEFTSAAQCGECHPQQHDEWRASWHGRSWIDPEFIRLSNQRENTDCIDCHAPRPVFITGLENRVILRSYNRNEGVDCLTCHLLPDGRIAGTVTNPNVACRPVETKDLVRPQMCAPCHDQHKTVQQWSASVYGQPGPEYKSCLDCHMPHRGGDPSAGRDHTMHGGHDLELVRSAVAFRARREGANFVIEVENVGAGHNYPTDERSRASDVVWRPLGEARWRHLYRFRNPYRHETGLPNTELAARATQRIELPATEVGGPAEVALFYKLSPYFADEAFADTPYYNPDPETNPAEDAVLVHRVEIAP